MEYIKKIVRFDEYCHKCKHHKKEEYTDPCNECLACPVNEHSKKPINFKENK